MVDGRTIDTYQALQSQNPHWVTYTPTVSATAGTITSYTSKGNYLFLAPKLIFIQMNINITNAGTGSGTLQATLPISFDPGNILSTLNGLETTMNLPADGILKSGDPTRISIYVFGSSVSISISATGTTSGAQSVHANNATFDPDVGDYVVGMPGGTNPVGSTGGEALAVVVSGTGTGALTYATYAGLVNNNINLSGFYAIK